jgi:Mce-associated membrane protein
VEVAISPAVDQYPEVTTVDPAPDPRPNHRFRLVLLVVLLVALVASAATLGWLLVDRDNGAGDDPQADREAVMSQVEQFVLRLNTYGPDQLDDQGHLTEYRDQVTEVITPKFASDFETSGLPIAEETVKTAGYGRTAKIFGLGVESIDEDSATVIVAAGMTSSYPDPQHPDDASKRVDADEDVLRWEVPVVKVDGEWLVDDYTPVTGEDAQ